MTPSPTEQTGTPRDVRIEPPGLPGILTVPSAARAVVLFAHGSGSSRLSPRNTFVAEGLREARLGTLQFDLLTDDEAADRRNIFDIALLGSRLVNATAWVARNPATRNLSVAYFGASTGAAAALVAATETPQNIGAVVSRGGRPDLAENILPAVRAPTLLIVGGNDEVVLELNEKALALMTCEKRLSVVPGASHLFEEPGKLEQVIALARDWFSSHLTVV